MSRKPMDNKRGRGARTKSRWVWIGAIIAVAMVMVATVLLLMLPHSIQPVKFGILQISGSWEEGSYTVLFSLVDQNNNNGPADGTAQLIVRDSQGNVLYNEKEQIGVADFQKFNQPSNGEFTGYAWNIPASTVDAGIPDASGMGVASLTFITVDGKSFSSSAQIPIARLATITIAPVITSDLSSLESGFQPVAGPIYPNETFNQTITLSNLVPVTIYGVTLSTPGFSLSGIEPQPPFDVGFNGSTVILTIEAPDYGYNGSLMVNVVTTPTIGGLGAMSVDSYVVTDNTNITVYLRNTGEKPLVIANAYVDGAAAMLSPMGYTLEVGKVQTFMVTGNGTNWADGLSHELRIVASDGTQANIAVKS